MLPRLIATLAVALVFATPAGAAVVRYASPSSSDASGACASVATACTLEHAVNAAPNNAEVIVAPGSYAAADTLSLSPGVDLHGENGKPRPVITSTAKQEAVATNPAPGQARIANLTLQGSVQRLIWLNDSGATIENVMLTETKKFGGTALWDRSAGGTVTVRNSVIVAHGDYATAADFEGAKAIVRGVTFWADGDASVGLLSDTFGNGPDSAHCTIIGRPDVDAVGIIAHGRRADLAAQTYGCATPHPARLAVSYSNYETQEELDSKVQSPLGHNSDAAPTAIFVDPGVDLHEKPGAPTIDAGGSAPATQSDVDGFPRVMGGAMDMGGTEYFGPDVAMSPASAVTTNTAFLAGTVNPNGRATKVRFEVGKTPAYGLVFGLPDLPGDTVPHATSKKVGGLDPATTYHVRLVSSQGNANYTRTTATPDVTFTTNVALSAPPHPSKSKPAQTSSSGPSAQAGDSSATEAATGDGSAGASSTSATSRTSAAARCVVPKLAGLTLSKARKALRHAGCKLGKVKRRKHHRRGGRVRRQSAHAGVALPAGAKVAVRLR